MAPIDWENDTLLTEVRLKDPSSHKDGQVFYHAEMADWDRIEVIAPAEKCSHEVTMCDDCIGDWASDYFLRISNDDGKTWYGLNDVPGLPKPNA
jgi:hypothetical protein